MSAARHRSRTGADFPRSRFEAALRADPEVTAAIYTGSLAAGTADAFSDLDVDVYFAPAAAEPRAKLERLAESLGALHFGYWRESLFTGFVGSSWQRVDLRLGSAGELEPAPRLAGGIVLKDADGRAAAAVARSARVTPEIRALDARQELSAAVDSQIYSALHIARGALWSAQGELVHRAQSLYALIARLRGVEPFGFRHVESLLSPKERAALAAAWPRRADRTELRRAARALWRWTEHARRDATRQLGADPGPDVDADQLLSAVERVHREARGVRR